TNYNDIKFRKNTERKLKLDKSAAPNEEFLVNNIAQEMPYLPIEDINNPKYKSRNLNNSCAWYPSLRDVKIHNDYWQEYKNGNISYNIFGAYLDNRPTVVENSPVVRVLTMIDFIAKTYQEYPMSYCQLWYDEQPQPFVVPMKEMHKIWYYEWSHSAGMHYAHFMSCPVPEEHKEWIPRSVSLVAKPCDKATNNVRVTYQPLYSDESRKDFAVCVKGLDYPHVDISHRIVEYVETMRSLGAEKILMYQLQVHPNTTKVLKYYEDTGFLEYRPMSLSTAVSNLHDYRHLEMSKNGWSYVLHEVIPYNDCLYRNMYRYKYVAVQDTDEILMPMGNITNWHDLINIGESITTKSCNKFASYCFRCITFICLPEKPRYTSDIPEYFYFLQHVERVTKHIRPDWSTKCLHSTDRVIATHNHFSMHRAKNVCSSYSFDANVAQLQHYRVPRDKKPVEDLVVDLSVWRFKDEIIDRSMKVFEELEFFDYDSNHKIIKFFEKNERKLKLDKSKAPDEDTFVENIIQDIPYLPIENLNNPKHTSRNFNSSCAWYPRLYDVKIHNDYWQEFNNLNISYYIFGAYLDNRPSVVQKKPVVRVLAMINFLGQKPEDYPMTYCHLWYDEQSQPFVIPMKEMTKLWYYEWGNSPVYNYAHFINFPLPEEHKDWIPRSVSLVAEPCDKATNNVRVTYQPLFPNEKRKDFAVCVKGLDYPHVDISHRIVEYVETMRSLGAEKILMYQLQVHPNTTKVLKYYEDTGFLEYRPMSLSTAVSNLHDYRHLEIKKNGWSYILHEVIPYNDCLYRNMYRYKYVAVQDTDEVLMPLGNITNWHDLMEFGENVTKENCKKFASFCFRCIYFPRYPQKPRYTNDIPEYFYMLQHVERVKEHIRPDWATKCLHSTDRVIGTHNHFPFHWASDVCGSYSFDADVAQLQHYREPDIKETLNDPVVDLSLWRFKDEIIERSTQVLEELNFFEDD
ncbi:hypothetical protein FF38_01399, partial [Lucilia cuprina]